MGLGRDRDRQRAGQCIERMVPAEARQVERLERASVRLCRPAAARRNAADAHCRASRTPGRDARPCRGPSRAAREIPAARDCPTAARRIVRPSSDEGGAAIGAAPRIRFHSSARLRSTTVRALSGEPRSRHMVPCCVRRFAPRAQRSRSRTLAASAATPTSSAKSTSRGITVGSAVGANSASTQALKLDAQQASPGPGARQRKKESNRPDRHRQHQQRKRHGEDDGGGHERPAGDAKRRAASHRSGRPAATARCRPRPTASRHRRRQRRRRQ